MPPLLEPLIEKVREIPFNRKFPKVEEVGGQEFKLNSLEDIDSIDYRTIRETLIDSLESSPKNFLEHIWGKDLIPKMSVDEELELPNVDLPTLRKQTEEAAIRYIELKKLWNKFKQLTQLVDLILSMDEEKLEKLSVESFTANRYGIERELNQLVAKPQINFYRDKTITITFDDFAKAIDRIDITRIRSCKWCHKAFWAGRKDQICCPPNSENEKYSICKNYYNVYKLNKKKKIEKRREILDELRENYKDKEVWACDATFKFSKSKSNLPKAMKLNLVPLKIIDVLCNDDLETVYKFLALDKSSRKEGYIEFKYNSRLKNNIERIFSFK